MFDHILITEQSLAVKDDVLPDLRITGPIWPNSKKLGRHDKKDWHSDRTDDIIIVFNQSGEEKSWMMFRGTVASASPVTTININRPGRTMKKGIHPNYREVVFSDTSCGFRFLTKSTVRTNQKTIWEDGNEYPMFVLDVSSASHPFYTGAGNRFLDAAGRIDRFNKRFGNNYGSKKKKADEAAAAAGTAPASE